MSKFRALVPIPEFGADAVCADDVRDQLLGWRAAVAARGGTLRANSLTRTVAQQQPLRDRYVAWLAAGKPAPQVAAASKPGRSGHQGGRSIDASTVGAFPKAPADQQVDLLWETGRPFGFTPIIARPDELLSERWHFDCFNGWSAVRDHLGYDVACLCAALDVGQAGDWQNTDRLLQALLLRAGFDIGEPDAIFGARSQHALRMAVGGAISESKDALCGRLRAMPVMSEWVRVV